MLVVGLTGGIGAGKSEASRLFEQLGAPVIDADVIARELTGSDAHILSQIRQYFGDQFFGTDGQLVRSALRERVFADPSALAWLEALLHPRVEAEIQRRLNTLRAQGCVYCMVAIPLLIEANLRHLVDRVLVVDAPEAAQIARVGARDGSPPETINAIVARQMDRHARLAAADDIIDNSGDLTALAKQVEALDRRYRAMASTLEQSS